jgi:hypothetical protein
VKHASRGIKGGSRQLLEYLEQSDEDKKGLQELSEDQRGEVLVACSDLFPRLKVDIKVYVEEEEEDEDRVEDKQAEAVTTGAATDTDAEDSDAGTSAEKSEAVTTTSSSGSGSSSSNSKAANMKKYLSMVQKQATISGDKVYENDLVSLQLTITRENVPEVRNRTQ